MKTNCIPRGGALVLPFALAVLLACNHGGENAASPAAAAATPASSAASAPEARPEHTAIAAAEPQRAQGHGGDPTHALLAAAQDLPLTGTQKTTVHSLEQQIEANEKETGAAFQTLHADLVAQVRAGKIDPAKLHTDEAASDTALQAHMAKEAETLNALHAALDPSQRKAAVAVVRTELSGHDEEHAGSKDDHGTDRTKRHLDRLTRELALDSAQQQQVASLLSDQKPAGSFAMQRDSHRERMTALLDAFEKEPFDAKTAAPPPAGMATAHHAEVEQHVAFFSKLLPILRPEQRDKLAAMMEKSGMGHGHDDD